MTERLVVLLDMDCFYVQVEERHHPHIKGRPAAVVQYNSWKGGGIIAVNYEARAHGVKRSMRGDEAQSKCPDIQLVQVPVNRGKADLTRYRDAGKEVIDVLCDYSDCVERASIDEAYIDFTSVVQERMEKMSQLKIASEKLKSTWVVGHDKIGDDKATIEDKEEIRRNGLQEWLHSFHEEEDDGEEESSHPHLTSSHPYWDNIRLVHTAVLCEEMRAAVLERTGFKCSAGIAHNKVLSKLSCGLHKPNQQTILPQSKVEILWQSLPVGKVRNLGGKLGDSLTEELGCKTMGDLASISLQQLMGRYDNKTAQWLHNLGKGIDSEVVTSRQLPKSIGCGKSFQGKELLNTREKVQKWMLSLAEELSERLNSDQTSNKRRAKTLTVGVQVSGDNRFTSMSRSGNLPSYCVKQISRIALSLIQSTNQAPSKDPSWYPAIKNISLCAGKFDDWMNTGSVSIEEMFKKARQNPKKDLLGSDCETLRNAGQNIGSEVMNTSVDVEQRNVTQVVTSDVGHKADLRRSDKTGHSFFKSVLQKRENYKAKQVKPVYSGIGNEPSVELCEPVAISSEKNANSDDESVGSNDLDLLVHYLSDEEKSPVCGNEISGEETDDSVYDASTDIDSSGGNRVQQSQDLFAKNSLDEFPEVNHSQECDHNKEKEGTFESACMSMTAGNDSDHLSIVHNEKVTQNELVLRKTNFPTEFKQNIRESGEILKVSVQELFPDLDNFDENLLSILPKALKLEVEKALKVHKTKTQQRKSGLWKYVTSNASPPKNMCTTTRHVPSERFEEVDNVQAGPSRKRKSEELGFSSDVNCAIPNCSTTNNGMVDSDHGRNCGQNMNEKCNLKIFDGPSKNLDTQDIVECDKCGLQISAFEMPEHADYHIALSLETDMRRETNQFNRTVIDTGSMKNGKNNKGKKKTVKDTKIQKLDAFFKL